MKREVSPLLAVVAILVALTAVQVWYWRNLMTSPRVEPPKTPRGGGGRGGGGEGGPAGLSEVLVETLAGGAEPGHRDGPSRSARFDGPTAVAVGADGSVYVADSRNHCIREISPGGAVSTAAGQAGRAGYRDGRGTQALFSAPAGLAVAGDGSLLVADTGNHRIRKVTPGGLVSSLAGSATPRDELGREVGGYRDGPACEARFRYPMGLAVASSGAVYVADAGNHCVRRIAAGQVTTLPVAGGAMKAPAELALVGDQLWVADTAGSALWVGPEAGPLRPWQASDAGPRFAKPAGLAAVAAGRGEPRLYAADSGSQCIFQVEADRLVLVAGQGNPSPAGWQDGAGDAAQFAVPAGMANGGDGTIYVADFGNNRVRRLVLTGVEGGAASGD
jgi:hypothetical protein